MWERKGWHPGKRKERQITAYLRVLRFPCGKTPDNEAKGTAGGSWRERERVSKEFRVLESKDLQNMAGVEEPTGDKEPSKTATAQTLMILLHESLRTQLRGNQFNTRPHPMLPNVIFKVGMRH